MASGRGHASTVKVLFAQFGPWQEGEVNAGLLEAVLGYSPARGPARLLLAALAALADEDGSVEGLTTDELCRVAGLANSTYRRARAALLASGEVSSSVTAAAAGGRVAGSRRLAGTAQRRFGARGGERRYPASHRPLRRAI